VPRAGWNGGTNGGTRDGRRGAAMGGPVDLRRRYCAGVMVTLRYEIFPWSPWSMSGPGSLSLLSMAPPVMPGMISLSMTVVPVASTAAFGMLSFFRLYVLKGPPWGIQFRVNTGQPGAPGRPLDPTWLDPDVGFGYPPMCTVGAYGLVHAYAVPAVGGLPVNGFQVETVDVWGRSAGTCRGFV